MLCFLKCVGGSVIIGWWIEMPFIDDDCVSMHIPLQARKPPQAFEMRCCHMQEIHLGSVCASLPLSSLESPLPPLAGGSDSINLEPKAAASGPVFSFSWESTGGRRSFCHCPPQDVCSHLRCPLPCQVPESFANDCHLYCIFLRSLHLPRSS